MTKIISPCISICKTDPSSGYWYGCGRTNDEKALWKDENSSNEWKIDNIKEIKSRLSGWQLSSFEESYSFKEKNGISLIKHKLLNKWRKSKDHACVRVYPLKFLMNAGIPYYVTALCVKNQTQSLVTIQK